MATVEPSLTAVSASPLLELLVASGGGGRQFQRFMIRLRNARVGLRVAILVLARRPGLLAVQLGAAPLAVRLAKSFGASVCVNLPLPVGPTIEELDAQYRAALPVKPIAPSQHATWTVAHADALRRQLGAADWVLCASSFVRDSVLRTERTAQAVVLPLGAAALSRVSQAVGNQSPPVLTEVRKLLFVGQLNERKGLTLLVTTLERLNRRYPDAPFELTMIGPGDPDVLRELNRRENVRVLGVLSRADLMVEYGKHDLLVMPSVADGWGLVMSEAVLAGTPVVGSLYSGCPDLHREVGASWIIDPLNADDLFATLRQIRDQPGEWQRMRDQALVAATWVGWDRYREDVVNFIDSIRGHRPRV